MVDREKAWKDAEEERERDAHNYVDDDVDFIIDTGGNASLHPQPQPNQSQDDAESDFISLGSSPPLGCERSGSPLSCADDLDSSDPDDDTEVDDLD